MDISVIIPTLQADRFLPTLLLNLTNQTIIPSEIIIIDSSSSDKTVKIAREFQCIVSTIKRNQFRHGHARNLGARLAHGEILVFMTQDAMPVNPQFLTEIVRPIQEGWAQAATARQIPYDNANPIEKLSRKFNYPEQSNLRNWQDTAEIGIKAVFFSNTASAIDQDVFLRLGGFSENVIVDEDLEFCTRMLRAGFSVAYQSQAIVYHSHNYSLSQLFRRYFDIGVFFRQARNTLFDIPIYNEGRKYISQSIQRLVTQNNLHWIPRFMVESIVKYFAFRLGLGYRFIPYPVKHHLSGQAYFWEESSRGKNE